MTTKTKKAVKASHTTERGAMARLAALRRKDPRPRYRARWLPVPHPCRISLASAARWRRAKSATGRAAERSRTTDAAVPPV
jgi:hypothetical protein